MTQANTLLSGLRINDMEVLSSGNASPIDGGRLAANFELRDQLAVDAQTQLDAVARNLVERFEQAGLDPTLSSGNAGLFTDQGNAFNPIEETGLANRISVSDAVQPDKGGAFWKLRDGLNASVPGNVGDATLLTALSGALSEPDSLGSGDLGATAQGATGHVAAMMSYLGGQRLALDQSVSFSRSNQAGLQEIELSFGVNTDDELQRLLLVEQAYNANARLVETVEEMIDALLRI
jgi:flagellar hook-associated protein 1 FlgK